MTELDEAKQRHDLVRAGMKEAGLELLVVASDWKHKGNLRYLAGRILWSRWAYIIFRAAADPILVMVAPSQRHWALKEGWIRDVRFSHEPITDVARLLKELGGRGRVGFAELDDTMRVADYRYLQREFPAVEVFDASKIVARRFNRAVQAQRFDPTPRAAISIYIAIGTTGQMCSCTRPIGMHWSPSRRPPRIRPSSGPSPSGRSWKLAADVAGRLTNACGTPWSVSMAGHEISGGKAMTRS